MVTKKSNAAWMVVALTLAIKQHSRVQTNFPFALPLLPINLPSAVLHYQPLTIINPLFLL